jgi:hypothetical protein
MCSRMGSGEVVRLTQGSPSTLPSMLSEAVENLDLIRRTRNREGAEGDRFTRSTEEAGPEKSGNRAEEKTLRTGKAKEAGHGGLRHRRGGPGKA